MKISKFLFGSLIALCFSFGIIGDSPAAMPFHTLKPVSTSITTAPVSAGSVMVFIGGQSNASPQYNQVSNPIAFQYRDPLNNAWSFCNGNIERYHEGYNTHPFYADGSSYCLTVSLAHRLSVAYNQETTIVNCAVGSTCLTSDTTVAPNGSWAASRTGDLFDRSVNNFFLPAMAKKTAANYWLVWVQGESDSNNQTAANNYQTNLAALYTAYKTRLGLPNLKIVVVKLKSTTYPYYATVRTAESNFVTANPGAAYLYDTAPLTLNSGGIHWDASSVITAGNSIAEIIHAN